MRRNSREQEIKRSRALRVKVLSGRVVSVESCGRISVIIFWTVADRVLVDLCVERRWKTCTFGEGEVFAASELLVGHCGRRDW